MQPNETILKTAHELALQAAREDEVPVGAIVYHSQTKEIISTCYNQTEKQKAAEGEKRDRRLFCC